MRKNEASKMKPKSKPKKPKPNQQSQSIGESTDCDFYFTVTRVIVSQICQSVGFKFAQTSALETLTSVAVKYIEAMAKSAATTAASANRSDANLFDLASAIRNLRSGPVLSTGVVNIHRNGCALASADLADIADFVAHSAETPFAKPIPRRPPPHSSSGGISIEGGVSIARPSHVPDWLPEFPATALAVRSELRRRCGEELWENCVERKENEGDLVVVGERNGVSLRQGKSELGNERKRVRFGLGLRTRHKSCA